MNQLERKLAVGVGIFALALAGIAGVRATVASVAGAECATPEQAGALRAAASAASTTVAQLKARGDADEKIVAKYRRELAVFESVTLAGALAASSTVDRALASVTRASSTLAAAEAKHKRLASQNSTEGRVKAALAAEDVKKARKALAAANTALTKARKKLATAQEKELAERQKLAEPLAARSRLTSLNVELETAREALATATADYEWAVAHPCGGEVELVATLISADARPATTSPFVADEGVFQVTLALEARGGDAWVIPSRYPTGLPQGDIYPFRTIPDSFLPSFGEYEIAALDGWRPYDAAGSSYRIAEGESRMFRLTLPVANGAEGCADASVGWEFLRWADAPAAKDSEERLLLLDYQTFRTDALTLCSAPTYIEADLVSVNEVRTNGDIPGDADRVEFQISFSVTAVGGDVFVDGDVDRDGASGDGLAWGMTPDSTTGTGTVAAIVTTMDGFKAADSNAAGNRYFKVADGSTRTFRFAAWVPAGTDNSAVGVMLSGIRWGTEPTDILPNYKGLGEDFRTDTVVGLYIR